MQRLQKITLLIFTIVAVSAALLVPMRSLAANNVDCDKQLSPAGKQIFCGNQASLNNDENTLNTVINFIATWLVGLIGAVLAVIILVSAVQIVASGGSPEAMKSAKNRLTQAAISLGLLISFRAILALLGI